MKTSESTLAYKHQQTITVKRTFHLPISIIWKAWSEPDNFKKWWGPKGYTCPDCEMDFSVGGKYLASMLSEDGKKSWSTGVYQEIIPMRKIVCTDCFADSEGNVVPASYYQLPGEWADALLITTEFESSDGKVIVKMQQSGVPAEMSEDCIKGWHSSFDKLEDLEV